jgi:hypothetical protein
VKSSKVGEMRWRADHARLTHTDPALMNFAFFPVNLHLLYENPNLFGHGFYVMEVDVI